MKTITLFSTFLFCWTITVTGQGVHLSPGDSLSVGFNNLDCHFSEGNIVETAVNITLGTDVLSPGESLRLEMFEDSSNEAPFASQIFSPAAPLSSFYLLGPSSNWGDHQGVIRLTMLSGSVDVLDGYFYAATSPNFACNTLKS